MKLIKTAVIFEHSAWLLATYDNKQRLQRLIYPEGILYSKEKGLVRTKSQNSFC
jgi:hypothetical protein